MSVVYIKKTRKKFFSIKFGTTWRKFHRVLFIRLNPAPTKLNIYYPIVQALQSFFIKTCFTQLSNTKMVYSGSCTSFLYHTSLLFSSFMLLLTFWTINPFISIDWLICILITELPPFSTFCPLAFISNLFHSIAFFKLPIPLSPPPHHLHTY